MLLLSQTDWDCARDSSEIASSTCTGGNWFEARREEGSHLQYLLIEIHDFKKAVAKHFGYHYFVFSSFPFLFVALQLLLHFVV